MQMGILDKELAHVVDPTNEPWSSYDELAGMTTDQQVEELEELREEAEFMEYDLLEDKFKTDNERLGLENELAAVREEIYILETIIEE